MKRLLLFLTVGLSLGGAGVAAYQPTIKFLEDRNRPDWRTAAVTEGDVHAVVNSTGTIKPVLSVTIGSFVSGPIEELYCEFNQEVKQGNRTFEPWLAQELSNASKPQEPGNWSIFVAC